MVIGVASGPELVDPDTDFRLAHQERPALLRPLGRIAGGPGGFGAAGVAGHRLTESLLTVGEADDGQGDAAAGTVGMAEHFARVRIKEGKLSYPPRATQAYSNLYRGPKRLTGAPEVLGHGPTYEAEARRLGRGPTTAFLGVIWFKKQYTVTELLNRKRERRRVIP